MRVVAVDDLMEDRTVLAGVILAGSAVFRRGLMFADAAAVGVIVEWRNRQANTDT
jgi:hypothetical protein